MTEKVFDQKQLFAKMQEKQNDQDLIVPPPSFTLMNSQIIEYCEDEHSLTTKILISKEWLNPYNTMQGGLINAAIDNAVGPLSLLVVPANMTRVMETKFLKPITLDLEYIYVRALLTEIKKRRLSFEVVVTDSEKNILTQAKVINYIL